MQEKKSGILALPLLTAKPSEYGVFALVPHVNAEKTQRGAPVQIIELLILLAQSKSAGAILWPGVTPI
jgi:hypothetical protein